MKRRAKFDRPGFLAIDPKCFGLDFFFFGEDEREPFTVDGETAIVTIEGPLTHHADWWCDSYDGIKERVSAALASKATNVLLVIDSPGGECSGCFETSRDLRAMARDAGKPLYAYVDGTACSGGYALACAAEQIAVSDTSFVGSIGVIAQLVDMTKLDAMFGLKYTLVTSGARKADGSPHLPTSEGAVNALQKDVTSLAGLFFALVAESRPALSLDAISGLEAGVMHGAAAVSAGLADVVTTRGALLKDISAGKSHDGPSAAAKGKPMGWKDEMKKAADEGDEEAKAALAALEDEDKKKDAEGDEDEKKKDAEGDEPKKKDDDDDKDEKKSEGDEDEKKKEAASAAGSLDVEALERIGKLEREAEANKAASEAKERDELLAQHDLTKGQIEILRKQPLAHMKQTLNAFGSKKTPVDPSAVSRTPITRGRSQGGGTSPSVADEVDRKMGLTKQDDRPRREGRDHILPGVTMTKETAREVLDANRKAGRGIVQ